MKSFRMITRVTGVLALLTSAAFAESAFDRDLARQAVEQARQLPRLHTLLVSFDGELVVEETFADKALNERVNIKSLSKTVLSALVGVAIHRGVFESVDQPIVDLLEDRVPEQVAPGVEKITVGHLLSLQAGLERTSGPYYGRWVLSEDWVAHVLTRPFVDEPGGRMLYSTGSTHLLSAALTEATGESTLALARVWLGEPLNIIIPPWPQDPQGIYFGGNDMRLSPLALLRVGELYRLGGEIDGRRVLPESWIQQSWQGRGRSAFTDDPYGYGWFIRPMAGQRAYYGRGFGGQMLYVLPDLGLTVVMTSDPNPPSPGGTYLRQLHGLLERYLVPAALAAKAGRKPLEG